VSSARTFLLVGLVACGRPTHKARTVEAATVPPRDDDAGTAATDGGTPPTPRELALCYLVRTEDNCVTRQFAAANACLRADGGVAPVRLSGRFAADRQTCRFPDSPGVEVMTNGALHGGDEGRVVIWKNGTRCLEQTTSQRGGIATFSIATQQGTAIVTINEREVRVACPDGSLIAGEIADVLTCNKYWEPPALGVTEYQGSRVELGEGRLDTVFVCAYPNR
jgi:hypothetical protein